MEVAHSIPEAHSQKILCLAYNPSQRKLFTGSEDATIKVWDVPNGKCERTLIKHAGWVTDLLFVQKFSILFSCSLDGTIAAWSPVLKNFYDKKLSTPCSCLAWDEKQKCLIAGVKETIHIYKVQIQNRYDLSKTMKLLELVTTVTIGKPDDFVRRLVCFDGKIVVGGFGRSLTIVESTTGRPILVMPKSHKAAVSVIAYDHDNNRFITGGFDKKVKVWNPDGSVVYKFGEFSDIITGICYNPITKTIWVTANTSHPSIFDALSGIDVTEYQFGPKGSQTKEDGVQLQLLQFVPFTSEIIGTTGHNKGIVVYKYNQYMALTTLFASGDVVEQLCSAWRNSRPQLFCVGGDCMVRKWEMGGTSDSQTWSTEAFQGHDNPALSVVYDETLNVLCTGDISGQIKLWSYLPLPIGGQQQKEKKKNSGKPAAATPEKRTTPDLDPASMAMMDQKMAGLVRHQYLLEGHTDKVTAMVTVPKGSHHYMVSVSYDMAIVVWEINRDTWFEEYRINDAHGDYILDVDYCPDREEFATCSLDGTVKVWKLGSWKLLQTLEHDAPVQKVRWNKVFGVWIAGCDDHTLWSWTPGINAATAVTRVAGAVTAMCIDLNFGYTVTATDDHIIRVYNTKFEEVIQEHAGHSDVITCVIHLKETNQYVSSSWDRTIKIWSAPDARTVDQSLAIGDLTDIAANFSKIPVPSADSTDDVDDNAGSIKRQDSKTPASRQSKPGGSRAPSVPGTPKGVVPKSADAAGSGVLSIPQSAAEKGGSVTLPPIGKK